jgi:hypothetical protein
MQYATNVSNNLYNWLKNDNEYNSSNCMKNLSSNQILSIANDINSIFSETAITSNNNNYKPELTLPRLVTVGTQSSGKSSVLSSIIGMDILPTGTNMVTRTPLDIRLHKTSGLNGLKEGWVEFGIYNGEWLVENKIPITVPTPTIDEVTKIKQYIMQKTNEIAGNTMNISYTPIIIKIHSPYVPNLSLIDLPGLTMVACVDKGQPTDIKEQIENLVISYIKQPRTIVIAVMQAKTDLETDLGLALIKKHDMDGKRTIGVLTKPDLMNYDTHVGEYLTNSISKNLMLTYGYYVVRNNTNNTNNTNNANYFATHPEYKKNIYKNNVGIDNLVSNLSKILICSINEMLPSVMTEIINLEMKINQKLDKMGTALPMTKDGKLALLNKYTSDFYYKIIDSIESRGNNINSGKQIKDIFVNYRSNLQLIKPFDNTKVYNNAYFKHIASNFEGNHMSFHIPPIQVLEACMIDDNLKPISALKNLSTSCVDYVCEIIIDLTRSISLQEEFAQFPILGSHIMSLMLDQIINPLKIKAKKIIINTIKYEEEYIWTDSKGFSKSLFETTKKDSIDEIGIRKLLESYFRSVKKIVAHSVPKIIMSVVIREIEHTLLSFLIHNVVTDDKIQLLKEDEGVEKQRAYYTDIKTKIETVKKCIPKI